MKHAREDYDRIQDPSGEIPTDEPVFLLRGQDVCAPEALLAWISHAEKEGAAVDIICAAKKQYQAMRTWQREKNAKLPDLKHGADPAENPGESVAKRAKQRFILFAPMEPIHFSSQGTAAQIEQYWADLREAYRLWKSDLRLEGLEEAGDGNTRNAASGEFALSPMTASCWSSSAFTLRVYGVLSAVRRSTLFVAIAPSTDRGIRWEDPTGRSCSPPDTAKASMDLDFSAPRNAREDLNKVVAQMLLDAVSLGYVVIV